VIQIVLYAFASQRRASIYSWNVTSLRQFGTELCKICYYILPSSRSRREASVIGLQLLVGQAPRNNSERVHASCFSFGGVSGKSKIKEFLSTRNAPRCKWQKRFKRQWSRIIELSLNIFALSPGCWMLFWWLMLNVVRGCFRCGSHQTLLASVSIF
jgi:hypothetical protein